MDSVGENVSVEEGAAHPSNEMTLEEKLLAASDPNPLYATTVPGSKLSWNDEETRVLVDNWHSVWRAKGCGNLSERHWLDVHVRLMRANVGPWRTRTQIVDRIKYVKNRYRNIGKIASPDLLTRAKDAWPLFYHVDTLFSPNSGSPAPLSDSPAAATSNGHTFAPPGESNKRPAMSPPLAASLAAKRPKLSSPKWAPQVSQSPSNLPPALASVGGGSLLEPLAPAVVGAKSEPAFLATQNHAGGAQILPDPRSGFAEEAEVDAYTRIGDALFAMAGIPGRMDSEKQHFLEAQSEAILADRKHEREHKLEMLKFENENLRLKIGQDEVRHKCLLIEREMLEMQQKGVGMEGEGEAEAVAATDKQEEEHPGEIEKEEEKEEDVETEVREAEGAEEGGGGEVEPVPEEALTVDGNGEVAVEEGERHEVGEAAQVAVS